MNSISLDISDVLLEKAVRVMLGDLGYTVKPGVKESDLVITDAKDCFYNGCRVLCVGRERKSSAGYLRRPFSPAELGWAVEQMLGGGNERQAYSELEIDKKRSRVTLDGIKILLTDKELALLLLLNERHGLVVSDAEIIERVWKNDIVQGSNISAVYVKYLRAKLDEKVGRRLIHRVRGRGYMLKLKEKE